MPVIMTTGTIITVTTATTPIIMTTARMPRPGAMPMRRSRRSSPGRAAGVAATFLMGLGTAITVAVIATIAVGAKAWAKRFADTRAGYGMLAMRCIEVAAALVIIAFGALLLTGYIVTERLIGV